ncbi:MAG: NUDIX hydrolase [Dermatophilaceae bacterium]
MTIAAAGTVPWRRSDGALQVALVHRPKYDDWSWTKGKLDPDEQWPVAAVRETFEETGLQVRLGSPLPPTQYRVLDRDGTPATKHVRYWAAQVTGGTGLLENEIDQVAWLDPPHAHDRLDYAHDRDQLRAVLRADQAGTLSTWPLVIVRHALAQPRSSWKRADHRRPLVEVGLERSDVVAELLGAYGVTELVTSPAKRCVQTIRPYAVHAGIEPRTKASVSEEGFDRKGPEPARRLMTQLLRGATPTAVCTHGPVLPTILKVLRANVPRTTHSGRTAYRLLGQALKDNLDKGEALVAHVAGTDETARIVAVERHRV